MIRSAEQTIPDAIAAYHMLQPGDFLLCALSGGADSVCMTHFLTLWGRERGITVAAAHYTHGLRLHAGEKELELTRSLCHEWGIPFFTEAGNTAHFAAHRKVGIEEGARLLRYDFLRRMAAAWGAKKIATAHNLGDQAETVLLHLIRGAGLQGLRGIPPVNGKFIRPLITTPRSQIEDYLTRHRLPWAEDETNCLPVYARNRIRLEILPLLEQLHPGATERIALAGFRLGQDGDALEELGQALLLPHGLDVPTLTAAPSAIAVRAIQGAYRRHLQEKDLTAAHINAVIGIAKGRNPSAQVSLPGGIARREYDRLIFEKAEIPCIPPAVYIHLGETIQWGIWEISVLPGSHPDGWTTARSALDFPLCVRSRQVGDRIFMGKHHKSVRKLMIERKIPEKNRDIVPVLCDNKRVFGIGGIGWEDTRTSETGEAGLITVTCRKTVTG